MSGAGILLMIDGEPVDLSKVSWFQKAPCGCVCGVTLGFSDYGKGPAHLLTTADAAMKQFHETKAEREKYERLGFTVYPDLHSKVKELALDCPHEPRWGYEKAPKPEGLSWAVGGYFGDRTRVQHLAPTPSVETEDYRPDREHWAATSLCGTHKSGWSAEYHMKDGKVECSRCVKKATASLTAAPTTEATS